MNRLQKKSCFSVTIFAMVTLFVMTLYPSLFFDTEFSQHIPQPRAQEIKKTGNEPEKPPDFCKPRSEVFWLDGLVDEKNASRSWNLAETWNCPHYHYDQPPLFRRKVHLNCSTGSPHLSAKMTNSPSDIQVVEPDNECLLAFVQNCCNDAGLLVPNVMHYIWYADVEVGFYTFVSFLSVVRFMRPCIIIFHGPYIPRGVYWNYFISVYPNVVLVNETLITEVFGHKLRFEQHGSDILRIKALQKYGGVYIDWDSVLVKPIESLRKYNFSMSLESPDTLGNQFLMAEPDATFLTHYYNGYKKYNGCWGYNSIEYPFKVAQKYPETIHILEFTGIKPPNQTGFAGPGLFYENYDWSENYALHLYINSYKHWHLLNVTTIRRANTTIAAVCRHIVFGRKEICN